MDTIILTDSDVSNLKGLLAARGRSTIDDITVDDVNLLALTFQQTAESARVARSNYDNIAGFRAALYAVNPADPLIAPATAFLSAWHEAWPDVLPAPVELVEVKR